MKNTWLEMVEYVSVIGSVAGTVAAVASKQFVYAAAPASAALLLNAVNRRRLEEQAEQNRASEQTQIHRQISEEMASVRASILALPSSDEIGGVKAALQTERQRLDRLEGIDLKPIEQNISELKQQYVSLAELVARTNEAIGRASVVSPETFESATKLLAERLGQLQTELSAQKQQVASVQENLQQLALSSSQPASVGWTTSGYVTAPNLEEQIEELRHALGQLQEDAQNRVLRQDFASLVAAHSALEQAVEPTRRTISSVREELDTLQEQFNRRSIETFQTTTLQQLEQLREALSKLQKRVDELPPASQPVDVKRVEELLAKIASSVAEAKAEMETRMAPLESLELEPIPENITQLRNQYAQLLESVAGVTHRLDGLAPASRIQTVETELAKAIEKINQLQKELAKVSVPNPLNLEQSLSEFRSELATLSSEIASVGEEARNRVERQDFAPLVAAVNALEQKVVQTPEDIDEVREQLAALSALVYRVSADNAQTETQQQLLEVTTALGALRSRVDALAPFPEAVNKQLAALREQVNRLSAETSQTETQQQLEEVTTALGALRSRVDALAPIPETVNKQLAALREQVNRISAETSQTATIEQLAEVTTALSRLGARVDELPAISEPVNEQLAALSALVYRLSADISQTETQQQLEEMTTALGALRSRVDALAPIPETIDEQLATLSQQVNRLSAATSQAATIQQLQEVKSALTRLQSHVQALPPVPENVDLSGIEGVLTKIAASVSETKAQMESRIALLQALDIQPIQEEIAQLKNQSANWMESLNNVTRRLDTLPAASRIENVERIIAQLRGRIDGLPQSETIDFTGVEEVLSRIAYAIAETKAQLESRMEAIEGLNLNAVKSQYANLAEAVGSIAARLESSEAASRVEKLETTIAQLKTRIDELPPINEPSDAKALEAAIAQIANALAETKSNLLSRIASLEALNLPSIPENLLQLQAALQSIESEHLDLKKREIENAQTDVLNQGDRTFVSHSDIEHFVKQSVENQLDRVNQLLKTIQAYEYELAFDRPGIRSLLEEALETSVERLIIVCPWLSRASIDRQLIEKMEAFLQRNGHIDIGWGNLKDIEAGEFPRRINYQWQTNDLSNGNLYDALDDLEQLRIKYPARMRLKILGTHENFLVRDRSEALLTTYNFLTRNGDFPDREVGLRTTDPRIIQGLIDRFDDSAFNPSNGALTRKRAMERLDAGDYQSAIDDYTHLIESEPHNANIYNNRGIARSHLGDQPTAIADYTKALQINPNEGVYYFNRGFARFNLDDYKQAIEDFSRAIELKPEDTDAYFYRGEAYRLLGNYESAIEDYTQALRVHPEDAVAYNNRGLARLYSGDRAGAIDDYTKALGINPDDAIAYFNRGVAQSSKGDYPGAIEDFDRALNLNPEYALAYHNRGLARAEMGEKVLAREDLQKAAEFFSSKGDSDNSKQALAALQKLQ